jgi:phenylacetate-CoA ligase
MTDQLSQDELPVSRQELQQRQLEHLQMVLNRAAKNVSYYHDLFKGCGFLPQDFESLEGLPRIPLTRRETILERQPYGMLAVPPHDVVRIHTALGPDGHPIVVAFTENDIRYWALLSARALRRARITRDDAVYIALDYGQSVEGLGVHYGAETIGATVIPRTNTVIADQLAVMKNYRASVLVGTPSYLLQLVHHMEKEGFDPKTLFLRSVFLVGEPCPEMVRRRITSSLFVNAYFIYGLDEILNPGIASEYADQDSLLVNEDHFILEIVDPEGDSPRPHGQTGELVVTTLTREAVPLIRYRTGELASLQEIMREDGRKALALRPKGQRVDDMVVVGVAKFYPRQIAQVLRNYLGGEHPFVIRVDRDAGGDHVEIQAEISEEVFRGEMVALTWIQHQVETELFQKFGVPFHLKWMEVGALSETAKFKDLRGENGD